MTPSTGTGELRFAASARLQRLFGRDLMPDDDSAIEELVKNAYDSNAKEVAIQIVRSSGPHDGEIEIRDNGLGLSLPEFRRVWMTAGYSEKSGQPLPHSGRVQVGEKGIGRFAADKLGQRLMVITKTPGAKNALIVTFDWQRFEHKRRLLSDIPIPYRHAPEALLPAAASGTMLRISGLRAAWDDKAVARLRHRLSTLLDPYQHGQSFRIVLTAPRRTLTGPIVPSEIRGADFEWHVTRSAQGKVRVRRRASGGNGPGPWETISPTTTSPAIEAVDFGPLDARFFYFIARPKKATIGDVVPGVSVYRDGMRVEPAGSASADWLGLLEKRAKRAGHMPLVPSRLFGFVHITREDNPGLQDATNRRSFISGPALESFRSFLTTRLAELEAQVESEVAQPRWEQSRLLKSQKLVQARYKTVSLLSLSLAHELRQPLQSINAASENISNYLRDAGIAIPQVDSATGVIQRGIDRIDKHIQFLKALGSGKQDTERFEIRAAVEEVLGALNEYAAARSVALSVAGGEAVVDMNRSTCLATLTNLVVNACQAIEDTADQSAHYVRIAIEAENASKPVAVRVEDDGPGIPESNRSRLFRRHTTTKQTGMGIGLVLWREALQMFGGELDCPRFADPTTFLMTLPRERHGTTPPG